MPVETSLPIDLCEAYVIGHLAKREAYDRTTHQPMPGLAYDLAIQYGAGLLSRGTEDAEKFLEDRGIDVEFTHLTDEPYFGIQAFRGKTLILDRVVSLHDLTAASAS